MINFFLEEEKHFFLNDRGMYSTNNAVGGRDVSVAILFCPKACRCRQSKHCRSRQDQIILNALGYKFCGSIQFLLYAILFPIGIRYTLYAILFPINKNEEQDEQSNGPLAVNLNPEIKPFREIAKLVYLLHITQACHLKIVYTLLRFHTIEKQFQRILTAIRVIRVVRKPIVNSSIVWDRRTDIINLARKPTLIKAPISERERKYCTKIKVHEHVHSNAVIKKNYHNNKKYFNKVNMQETFHKNI
ncbi:hypothetical protein GQX74_013082 [Glossina fuscipes]|nr:hypothetical protein GQX74_013082 [Glossina fuscipes]